MLEHEIAQHHDKMRARPQRALKNRRGRRRTPTLCQGKPEYSRSGGSTLRAPRARDTKGMLGIA
jgi:hypothetical protein